MNRPDLNDIVCEVDGCEFIGSLEDFDGKMKCQKHLMENALAKKPDQRKIKIINTKRNDPCPCGSELKFKKCCGDQSNKHRQFLLQRIGRKVYYEKEPPFDDPTEQDLKGLKTGFFIKNIKHVRMLDEWTQLHDIKFVDIKPIYKSQVNNLKDGSDQKN